MKIIPITANAATLSIAEKAFITAGSIGSHSVQFEFTDSNWDDLIITAVFTASLTYPSAKVTKASIAISDKSAIYIIPAEVLRDVNAEVTVTLLGVDATGNTVRSTSGAIITSGISSGTPIIESVPPMMTPTLAQQWAQTVNKTVQAAISTYASDAAEHANNAADSATAAAESETNASEHALASASNASAAATSAEHAAMSASNLSNSEAVTTANKEAAQTAADAAASSASEAASSALQAEANANSIDLSEYETSEQADAKYATKTALETTNETVTTNTAAIYSMIDGTTQVAYAAVANRANNTVPLSGGHITGKLGVQKGIYLGGTTILEGAMSQDGLYTLIARIKSGMVQITNYEGSEYAPLYCSQVYVMDKPVATQEYVQQLIAAAEQRLANPAAEN